MFIYEDHYDRERYELIEPVPTCTIVIVQENERQARDDLQKTQTEDDNATEMANNIYGDILTENPAAAQSAFGAHRVVTDRWKGMSPEQLADIRRVQDIQRKENQVGTCSRRDNRFEYGIILY